MRKELLKNHRIILASNSPRRQQFFKDLGLDFIIKIREVEENYPLELKAEQISDYLAILKAESFKKDLKSNDIVITSDTIVWHQNEALGKPKDFEEAYTMLRSLSGKTHEVFTSVCFTSLEKQELINCKTKVTFRELTDDEINYYIPKGNPFDKSGAYGIQEWIGQIGIIKIEGTHFNVMGLPIHLVYKTILDFVSPK